VQASEHTGVSYTNTSHQWHLWLSGPDYLLVAPGEQARVPAGGRLVDALNHPFLAEVAVFNQMLEAARRFNAAPAVALLRAPACESPRA
jgi:hypothetical protein